MPRVRSPYGAKRCILCLCVCERVGVELCSLCDALSHSQRARPPSVHTLYAPAVCTTQRRTDCHTQTQEATRQCWIERRTVLWRAKPSKRRESESRVCYRLRAEPEVPAAARPVTRFVHFVRPSPRRPSASPHARTVLFTEPWPPPRPASRSPLPQCRGPTSTATAAIATACRPTAHSASRRR